MFQRKEERYMYRQQKFTDFGDSSDGMSRAHVAPMMARRHSTVVRMVASVSASTRIHQRLLGYLYEIMLQLLGIDEANGN